VKKKLNIRQRANDNAFEPEAFSIDAARQFLGGCSKSTLYEQVRIGTLKAHKMGRRTLFFRADLINWLNSLPQKSEPSAEHSQRSRERWAAKKQTAQV
jgi:excisionase family DNA binding protein